MKCPCGAIRKLDGKNIVADYNVCCEPFHTNQASPSTAEQLMRSRYSAYALEKAQYVYDTYHSRQQANLDVKELADWANQTTWLHLSVEDTSQSTVTFVATYAEKGQLFQIKEHSRFEQEDSRWKYVDGDIAYHEQLTKPKRNAPCPCQSGKKLKQCCGVKSRLI